MSVDFTLHLAPQSRAPVHTIVWSLAQRPVVAPAAITHSLTGI